jgi:hypothetical protein
MPARQNFLEDTSTGITGRAEEMTCMFVWS